MKLEFINRKESILSLNRSLPEEHRWPFLETLLSKVEDTIPLFSVASRANEVGSGIFIGWGCSDSKEKSYQPDNWFYHYSVSILSNKARLNQNELFGYHNYDIQDFLSGRITIKPVFNIGSLPESKQFAKLLRSLGIQARQKMLPLSPVEFYERNSNNGHTRVL